ncbi:hypothetical protein DOTSEDRAFT_52298 [Dothistroma septosporum NZE10]|uniref:Uncharacterized protein n=1 Tax=Dothistroma septosporum (strain NZE10 / CBS 128990) TaxID=675120 RepID=N1PPJ8_DOTSN|nr:hypothetical protein DOTSEDRAFT_52298 [Dothistroma septosporum NZE10]
MGLKRCASLDDSAFGHHRSERLAVTLSSSDWSDVHGKGSQYLSSASVAAPKEPIRCPPERIKTPIGAPRWPLDVDADSPQGTGQQAPNSQEQTFTSTQASSHDLPFPRVVQRILRVHRTPKVSRAPTPAPATRGVWRPPVSGQSTNLLADLSQHPLAIGTSTLGAHRVDLGEASLVSPMPGPGTSTPKAHTTNNDRDTSRSHSRDVPLVPHEVSPSQLSLRYAADNAIPASPEMVCSHFSRRNARLPKTLSRPSNERSRSLARAQTTGPADSVRTDELLQSFPTPPAQGENDRRVKDKPPPKRDLWSVFPTSTSHRCGDMTSNPRQPRFADPRATHAVNRQHSQAADCDLSAPVGEELPSRHRHLEVPFDDANNVSLHRLDRRQERHSGESCLSVTPSLGTRALQGPTSERTENERAVANGALRYDCGSAGICDNLAGSTLPDSTSKLSRPYRIAPPSHATPVIRGPPCCRHKSAKLKARLQSSSLPRMDDFAIFDGSTGPSEVAPAQGIEVPSITMPTSNVVQIPTPASAAVTFATAASDLTHVSSTGGTVAAMGVSSEGIVTTGSGRA